MKRFFLLFFTILSIHTFSQKKKDTVPKPKWKINGKFMFTFNQSSFTNWAPGGQNTVATNFNLNYNFNYKKDNVNWDTRLLSSYGLSHISEKGLRKTDDRFDINSVYGLKASKYWFFSFFSQFKTQFTKGHNYKTDPKVLVSEFLSPAYLTFGPGMLWKKSDDLNVNISPATAKYTFVNDFFSGKFGVEEGKNTAFALGFNLSGYYKFRLMENIEMENILNLYTDYLGNVGNVNVDYQTNTRFKINKSIKLLFTLHTIADDNSSSKVQFRQVFGLGLNYIFHEKVTY